MKLHIAISALLLGSTLSGCAVVSTAVTVGATAVNVATTAVNVSTTAAGVAWDVGKAGVNTAGKVVDLAADAAQNSPAPAAPARAIGGNANTQQLKQD
ncbi:hypothetical protein SAMN02745857_00404 [Andreprevotia lacus DSM 23236]|jgi:hypothetical protein|uniref:Lipoprotein n=1 Tax=Andreprevotia lacus DSM 23236 TaxID=1121001 RepID=A0A1W1X1D9_9NEIS|nr:hypothetical protein [Andreprevotia lacus]SMC17779.1 hypothetical protein SAMN02745857_00404 [Andreprevotia lacus DSM 23236]